MNSFEVWKTIELGADQKSFQAYEKEFKKKGITVSPVVSEMFRVYGFAPSPGKTKAKVAFVPVKQLTSCYGIQIGQICGLASEHNLELFTTEDAFRFRCSYTDQPRGERIWIATKPFEISKGKIGKKGYRVQRKLLFADNQEGILHFGIGQGNKCDPSGLLNADQILAFIVKENSNG